MGVVVHNAGFSVVGFVIGVMAGPFLPVFLFLKGDCDALADFGKKLMAIGRMYAVMGQAGTPVSDTQVQTLVEHIVPQAS
jgi:hypothetical protein